MASCHGQLAAGFINAAAANVSHPFDDIMVTVVQLRLEYLQVAHLEAGGREWHLGRGQLRLGPRPSYQSSSTLASSMVTPHLPQGVLNGWVQKQQKSTQVGAHAEVTEWRVTRNHLRSEEGPS